MTVREQKMAVGVGAGLALFLAAVVGYVFIVMPLDDRARAARALEDDVADKDAKFRTFLKDRARLDDAKKRSLPANLDVARQEYDAAINRVLRDAKVPLAASSVTPKPTDGKATPELAPKKPAYTRVTLEVKLKPIDIGTLVNVLTGYYKLNLLQQITTFKVKKAESGTAAGGSAGQRRGPIFDRADLEVTLVTEAIILDGAENRKSLLPVPIATAATGGGLGYAALTVSPAVTRGLTPLQFTRVLADPTRDYAVLIQKDPIHGPPLPPAAVVAPTEEPKEDTSTFIRLTGAGRNSDGTGSAFIVDVASHQEYEITISRKSGKLVPEVAKYYHTAKGIRKPFGTGPDLEISDASSSTARKFRVVGIDDDGLVLAERLDDAKKSFGEGGPKGSGGPKGPGGPGSGRGGGRRGGETPISSPAEAVTGPAVEAVPPEKVFLWRHGESLKKVTPLPPAEAVKVIQRATGGPSPEPATPPPTGTRVARDAAEQDGQEGLLEENE